MKYIKNIKQYFICRKYGIKNWDSNKDGSINVNGNVDLYSENLSTLPIKFKKVDGTFRCWNNSLINLINGPEYVTGGFECESNQISSFEGTR